MIEVLVVVPYEELEAQFLRAIERIKSEHIHFSTILHVRGANPNVLKFIKNYDIVVVRGMTSSAVSRFFPEINKIDIAMTGYDILDALLKVRAKRGVRKTGLLLSSSCICAIETLKRFSQMDLEAELAGDEAEMAEKAEILLKRGCEVLIGGLTLFRYCSAHGIPCVPIETGSAAIENSIRSAVEAAEIMEREHMRSGLFNTIINNNSDSIFAVDKSGSVIAANNVAKMFFNDEDLVGKKAALFYPQSLLELSSDGGRIDIVNEIGGRSVLITQSPICENGNSGTIVQMQTVDDVRQRELIVRSQLKDKGLVAKYRFSDIVAKDVVMRLLVAKAMKYAGTDGNVLVTGETGTGKELFVQSIHNASSRASGPFVAVNCATLSEQLLESELFGTADGASPGASKGGKKGLFELAHGGTIFLDEIAEMPIRLQAKILRILQEHEVRKIGGNQVIPVDVRVMSATNYNIPDLIEKGLFRSDLYYRINLLSLSLPPLRERTEDIGALFTLFIRKKAERLSVFVPKIEPDAIAELRKYRWNGNIRELKNVAERIMVLNDKPQITATTVRLAYETDTKQLRAVADPSAKSAVSARKMRPDELREAFERSGQSLCGFARDNGISRTTLWRRFKKDEKENAGTN